MPPRKVPKIPIYKKVGLTRKSYYDYDIVKPKERDFIKRFTRRQEKIKWIERNLKVSHNEVGYLPTNDFVQKGKEWELKSKTEGKIKERTIIRRINEAVDKWKRNIFLDLGNRKASTKLVERLQRYNISRANTIHKKRYVKNIVVWDKTGVFKIDTKN